MFSYPSTHEAGHMLPPLQYMPPLLDRAPGTRDSSMFSYPSTHEASHLLPSLQYMPPLPDLAAANRDCSMYSYPSTYDAPYSLPSFPYIPSTNGTSRKRAADDIQHEAPAAKRAASTAEVVFRLVVPGSKIGKVIGKQGAQIRQLREQTDARIKIVDAIIGSENRVILISSKDEACSTQTSAEITLLRLVTLLLEEQESTTTSTGPQHVSPNLTRLLIEGSQAGGLIGKAGATINSIRENSGATVRILPSDQLPPSITSNDTDRLIQISGESLEVQKALELVAAKLRKSPPTESMSAQPSYFVVGQTGYDNLACQNMNSMLPKVTYEMSIPSVFMGGIIGKGGAKINQIRTVSGASIKVHGTKEGTSERTITMEGTSEQVAAAQSLIQGYLNSI